MKAASKALASLLTGADVGGGDVLINSAKSGSISIGEAVVGIPEGGGVGSPDIPDE